MGLSQFRLITFDVAGTLLRIRSTPGKQYGELGAMFGVYCDSNDLVKNFRTTWKQLNKEHPNFGLKTKIGWQNWWQQLVISTLRDSGVQTPESKLIELSEHLKDLFKGSTCWQPCFGTFELLNFIQEQQRIGRELNNGQQTFKVGIISNFDPRLPELLKNMKIDQFFDFTLYSYDVGYEKPDRRIFDKAIAMSHLKCLQPNECLHIGDLVDVDYLGAKEAGWSSALITGKPLNEVDPLILDKINEQHVFTSLYDFHKKISNDSVCW